MMKKKILYTLMAVMFVGFTAKAQTPGLKIGYTNTEYVLSLLPAAKQIQTELTDYNEQLTKQLKLKETTLQTKIAAYQKEAGTMTELIRKDKEREIQSLESSLRQFQQEAQTSFTAKQQNLLSPVLEKIQGAIKTVAEENNFTHILNSGSNGMDVLLFAKEEFDISNLVLAKLGVEAPTSSN